MVLTHDNESEKTVLGLYVNLPGTNDLELIGIYESQKNRRFIVIDDIVSGFDYYYRLYTESDGGRSEVSRFWRLQNPKKGC